MKIRLENGYWIDPNHGHKAVKSVGDLLDIYNEDVVNSSISLYFLSEFRYNSFKIFCCSFL